MPEFLAFQEHANVVRGVRDAYARVLCVRVLGARRLWAAEDLVNVVRYLSLLVEEFGKSILGGNFSGSRGHTRRNCAIAVSVASLALVDGALGWRRLPIPATLFISKSRRSWLAGAFGEGCNELVAAAGGLLALLFS